MKCEVLCMWIHIFRNYKACNLTIVYKFFIKEMTIVPSFVLCKYRFLYTWSCAPFIGNMFQIALNPVNILPMMDGKETLFLKQTSVINSPYFSTKFFPHQQ